MSPRLYLTEIEIAQAVLAGACGWMSDGDCNIRPEFLNRIDEIIEFHALSQDHIGEIVELQLARLHERLRERGIELELSDEARALIAGTGWDPAYGARPLKRALQQLVENPLAQRLLSGELGEGQRVRASVDGTELAFDQIKGAVATAA